MSADLPPSSRNRRFIVGAPFSMMRLPVAVEPVNEIRSTRGLDDELLADEVVGRRDDVEHARRDVGLLGDEPAEAGGVPRRVGRGLEDHVLPVASAWPIFCERHLERVVPRHDRADDAGRLLARPCAGSDRRTRGRRGARAPTRTGR